MIARVALKLTVAAFGLIVLASLTAPLASATPSIPIPPPVSGSGLHR